MSWTEIAATRYDQDSPEDEDLWGDIIANAAYNYDHALRCGIHATGARNCMAHGVVSFSDVTVGANKAFTGTVTFATDAIDGDPNFSTPPTVILTLEQVTDATYEAWTPANSIYAYSAIVTARDVDTFTYRIQFYNALDPDLSGKLHWRAVARVTAGE